MYLESTNEIIFIKIQLQTIISQFFTASHNLINVKDSWSVMALALYIFLEMDI